MICEDCGQRPATVHLTRVVNGEKSELHLCETCAREHGELEFWLEPKFNIHELLGGFFGQAGKAPGQLGSRTKVGMACPRCGLTYGDFSRTGLLGCAQCYETFAQVIEPIARRVHGSTRHVGKVPGRGGKGALLRRAEALRSELQRAVEEERYEDAARLRDELRELQRQIAGERESR